MWKLTSQIHFQRLFLASGLIFHIRRKYVIWGEQAFESDLTCLVTRWALNTWPAHNYEIHLKKPPLVQRTALKRVYPLCKQSHHSGVTINEAHCTIFTMLALFHTNNLKNPGGLTLLYGLNKERLDRERNALCRLEFSVVNSRHYNILHCLLLGSRAWAWWRFKQSIKMCGSLRK